ncbi:uncharacterized protein LOC117167593 [Belonocnema kinseyi]|uniref:uncharacterized protein LOC117167593 n=1 Tax=Belonocnema kinseyi TaxID=2817044 RepID=UPI00143CF761|nr:uncharacterized protein LOC117167593 [Belonocnema kinseyi]
MGHYARGDSRKVGYSSEDDEGYHTRALISASTIQRMSHLNLRDKNNNRVRVSGEAPSLLTSTILDETDCQFWAEDELSSSDSKNRLVSRRKRRRSVSYRNRTNIQKSRSALFQSSSSNSSSLYIKMSTTVPSTTLQKQRRKYRPERLAKKAKLERELFSLLRKLDDTKT